MNIPPGQIEMLCNDMAKEYGAGNYVLCGGDFNHDLRKGRKRIRRATESWHFSNVRCSAEGHFTFCLDLLSSRGAGAALGTDVPVKNAKYGICWNGCYQKKEMKLVSGSSISDRNDRMEKVQNENGKHRLFLSADHDPAEGGVGVCNSVKIYKVC